MTFDEERPPEKVNDWGVSASESHSVAMLSFSVFLHVSPVDFNTAGTTVWHQSKTQRRNDPSIIFGISFLSSRKVLKI